MIIIQNVAYLPRALESTLEARLMGAPVVVLTGARQTGKSTLVQHFPPAGSRHYRSLDDLENLELANDAPDALIADRPLTLDEVQRAPSLLLAIKRAVDRKREAGQFLLTGSANLLLMQKVSETLAGRAQYLTLLPMTDAEVNCRPASTTWSELAAATGALDALSLLRRKPLQPLDLDQALLRGGYPPVVDAGEDDRTLWFDGYVRTYLERDLQQLAQIDALVDFRRLMRASALRSAALLNQAELARDAGLSPATAHRYLNLLEVSYQIHRLPAYAVNRTKRLIKAPKLYWTDTGLAAFLAGADRHSPDPMRPALCESFVLGELLSWREREVPRPDVTYWRTASGEEVDFIVEWKNRLLPVEVKSSAQARGTHAKTIESFVCEYADVCRFGIVVYCGTEVRQLSEHVIAAPLRSLI